MSAEKPVAAGYSGTPLAKKLGIKSNSRIRLAHEPEHYFSLFTDLPVDVKIVRGTNTKKDLIHYFAVSASDLEREIGGLRQEIEENGAIWISWPKKTANMKTDLNENIIRDIALRNKLVDVKVCAIDQTWSGLKLVIRVKDRK